MIYVEDPLIVCRATGSPSAHDGRSWPWQEEERACARCHVPQRCQLSEGRWALGHGGSRALTASHAPSVSPRTNRPDPITGQGLLRKPARGSVLRVSVLYGVASTSGAERILNPLLLRALGSHEAARIRSALQPRPEPSLQRSPGALGENYENLRRAVKVPLVFLASLPSHYYTPNGSSRRTRIGARRRLSFRVRSTRTRSSGKVLPFHYMLFAGGKERCGLRALELRAREGGQIRCRSFLMLAGTCRSRGASCPPRRGPAGAAPAGGRRRSSPPFLTRALPHRGEM